MEILLVIGFLTVGIAQGALGILLIRRPKLFEDAYGFRALAPDRQTSARRLGYTLMIASLFWVVIAGAFLVFQR